jgi:hypothetical protein
VLAGAITEFLANTSRTSASRKVSRKASSRSSGTIGRERSFASPKSHASAGCARGLRKTFRVMTRACAPRAVRVSNATFARAATRTRSVATDDVVRDHRPRRNRSIRRDANDRGVATTREDANNAQHLLREVPLSDPGTLSEVLAAGSSSAGSVSIRSIAASTSEAWPRSRAHRMTDRCLKCGKWTNDPLQLCSRECEEAIRAESTRQRTYKNWEFEQRTAKDRKTGIQWLPLHYRRIPVEGDDFGRVNEWQVEL